MSLEDAIRELAAAVREHAAATANPGAVTPFLPKTVEKTEEVAPAKEKKAKPVEKAPEPEPEPEAEVEPEPTPAPETSSEWEKVEDDDRREDIIQSIQETVKKTIMGAPADKREAVKTDWIAVQKKFGVEKISDVEDITDLTEALTIANKLKDKYLG